MSSQLALEGTPAPEPKLTERQELALQVVREHGPIASDDLGAHLHAERYARTGRGHGLEGGCEWCRSEGAQVARALERKGLIRRIRGEGWVDIAYRTPVEAVLGVDPKTAPLPEGF